MSDLLRVLDHENPYPDGSSTSLPFACVCETGLGLNSPISMPSIRAALITEALVEMTIYVYRPLYGSIQQLSTLSLRGPEEERQQGGFPFHNQYANDSVVVHAFKNDAEAKKLESNLMLCKTDNCMLH